MVAAEVVSVPEEHSGREFGPAYWEERYRAAPAGAGAEASLYLRETAGDLPPGTALDAGCGEGADTVWLAARGWRVTAADVSPTALDRARGRAARVLGPEAARRIAWVRADLTDWTPPAGGFALVTSHYVHAPGGTAALVRRLAAAVAPGGTLLVVGHHHTEPHGSLPHARVTTADLAASLGPAGGWEVTTGTRTRTVTARGGRTILRDAVLTGRRRL